MKFSIFQNFRVRPCPGFGNIRCLLTFDLEIDHFQALLGGTLHQTRLNTKCFPYENVWGTT